MTPNTFFTEISLFGTDFEGFPQEDHRLQVLSCGAGMQSTALALMSCEMKIRMRDPKLKWNIYPEVPIYDVIIFCDLGLEPPWVYDQVAFIKRACDDAGILFVVLDTHLYEDYVKGFGFAHMKSIPFWTINPDGKKAMMTRVCTIEYKIKVIEKYIRENYLHYRKGQRIKKQHIGSIDLHIGFSYEEKSRANASKSKLFVNKFPLIKMKAERHDNFKYIKEKWGLETKASACCICPFHRNFFFRYLKEFYPQEYNAVVRLDNILDYRRPLTPIKSELYISRSRKRISDLSDDECGDAEFFSYNGKQVWNGF